MQNKVESHATGSTRDSARLHYLDWLRVLAILIVFLFVTLSACSANTGQDKAPRAIATLPKVLQSGPSPASPDGSSLNVENATWPANIPHDIPPLEGGIRLVMEAPGSHIRIFYAGMTQRRVDEYLSQLKQQGFDLEFIVYTQEGFPDNSQERLQRGDYDAVDIRKGKYYMRLEYGGDTAVYDVYTSGWQDTPTQEPATAAPVQWPQDIAGKVPPPEGCELVNVARINEGGYHITCTCKGKDADLAYL
jgi:hypothetical protein